MECYLSSAELLIPNFILQDEGDDEYWSFCDSRRYPYTFGASSISAVLYTHQYLQPEIVRFKSSNL